MHNIKELQDIFSNYLAKQDFLSDPKELYNPIVYAINMGGKRLRPVCLLAACEMFGGDYRKALNPAVGIELFHNFTLIHDDIMDNASLRRGEETVYKKWNTNIGILSGDTMFAIAFDYMMRVDDDLIRKTICLFDKTAIEVCEGQQYDLNYESSPSVTIEEYINMIRLKTGVLVAASLKMGAIIARASEQQAELLYQFGIYLGLSFQLVDDLLDAFPQDKKFGKKKGGDILSNKKTYLYLKGNEMASIEERKLLHQLFSDHNIDPELKIESVIRIWNDLKVPEATQTEIKKYHCLAMDCLEKLSIADSNKTELLYVAKQLLHRTS